MRFPFFRVSKVRMLATVLLLAGTLLRPSEARAQIAEIAASTTVGQLVQSLKVALQDVIEATGSQVNQTSFALRQRALVLLDGVDAAGNGLLDKTFGELNASQQQFFRSAHDFTLAARTSIADVGRTGDDLLARVNVTLSRIPFVSRAPYVTESSPTYLVVGDLQDSVSVTIRGSLLGRRRAALAFGDEPCRLHSQNEVVLTFLCPVAVFISTDTLSSRSRFPTGDLSLIRSGNLFRRTSVVHYRVGVTVVPPLFATYTATIVGERTDRERDSRVREFPYINPHCAGVKHLDYDVDPVRGWFIDVNSVRTRVLHMSQTAAFLGIHNLTEHGFQVRGRVENSGSCVGPFKDARGVLNLRVRWREWRPVPARDTTVIEGSLDWGEEVVIPLPSEERNSSVQLRLTNGQTVIITRDNLTHAWFTATYDRGQRFVIRPRPIAEALQSPLP